MSEQTLAEYAIQKIAKENIDTARESVMNMADAAIDMGFPVEFIVRFYQGLTEDKIAAGELTKESVFLVECWIREAYEKAEKEK